MDITDSGSDIDSPQQLGRKEYCELGGTVSLILSMCKPIFGTAKDVVLYSVFLSKSITNLEAKGFYAGSLINKRCYCMKESPADLIDAHF